jgi:hypothetical protein
MMLMTGSALASHDPSGEPFDEDFVTGSAGVTPDPANPCSDCKGIRLDAHSGPLGENPSGSALYSLRQSYSGGPVTCLTVDGRRAVVGGQDDILWGAYLILVEDNAGTGTPDRFAYNFLSTPSGLPEPPAGCPDPDDFVPNDGPIQTVIEGDLVVHDAGPPVPTGKGQCKSGGWRNFPGFKNQGSCISFVNH